MGISDKGTCHSVADGIAQVYFMGKLSARLNIVVKNKRSNQLLELEETTDFHEIMTYRKLSSAFHLKEDTLRIAKMGGVRKRSSWVCLW